MDAKYASLVNNGVQFCDGQALGAPHGRESNGFSDRPRLICSPNSPRCQLLSLLQIRLRPASNIITLSGTAPVTVKDIFVNGYLWACHLDHDQ